ncbi:MAG: DUF4230 domain-containing protein [Hymenobacteraceae bacterium]|nr:DUF4230 domain-containing protein [Hymenobacteraceae bacterium]
MLLFVRRLLPGLLVAGLILWLWPSAGPAESWLARLLHRAPPRVDVTHQTVLRAVEDLGKLELVRYQFRDVIEYTERGLLVDDKLALIVAGEAVGCLDLRKIKPSDVVLRGDSVVEVTLPAPELCYYKVDHARSRVFRKDTFFFSDDAALVDKAYRAADKQVRRAALASGILAQTQRNADQLLVPLLTRLSGRRVVIVQRLTVPAGERQ